MNTRPSFPSLQKDALLMLSQAQTSAWKVPAEALNEVLAQQGFSLGLARLPKGQLWLCDFWRKRLLLSYSPSQQPPQNPVAQQRLKNWSLATALGHIRLHQHFGMPREDLLTEQLATEYAMAFLLPRHLLREHPVRLRLLQSLKASHKQAHWRRYLDRMAHFFDVPVRCVLATLEHYGMLTEHENVPLKKFLGRP